MRKVLHSRPANATQWSVCSVAAQTGMSKGTGGALVCAIRGSASPHQVSSFPLTRFLVEKVRDVVGLYLKSARRRSGTVRR